MSPSTESIVKRLVVLATIVGLGSGLAFLLVACGGADKTSAARPPAAWQKLPAAPIRVDASLDSVWTGKELIVSGVRFGPTGNFIGSRNVTAAYNPATRTWRRLAPAPKMDDYCKRDVAWTGMEMVLWGCGQAALDLQANSWKTLPKAPTGQGIVVWTGREMIGWGGGCCGDAWDGGSAYDPGTNAWRTIARTPLAPSQGALRAWTGREALLLVSGIDPASGKPYPASFARAAAYNPRTDTWRRLAAPPTSGFQLGSAAAWDSHELVVVGAGADAQSTFTYDPATNRWHRRAAAPLGLRSASAFWTGSRLLVWGGGESTRAFAYDPRADRWSVLPTPPLQGSGQTAAWAGGRLIVWSSAGGAAFTPSSERSAR
jgi:hypothetical protein